MAVNISVLKKRGVSSGNYRRIFTALSAGETGKIDVPSEDRPKFKADLNRAKKLVDLISGRCKDGKRRCLEDYRIYWAIDLAHEVPFNQTTPTLVQNFLSQKWNSADDALKAIESWGLREKDLFIDVPMDGGGTAKMINPPIFFQILIPIVKAYTTNRLAKIFNERNQSPLLPCDPVKQTVRNRIACEIITDLVETISSNFGYPAVLREAILQMLKYGVALSFPREEWYFEDQLNEDGKVVTDKEGLRYIFPHPSRMFSDLMYPTTTLNTDTGCEFAGHWSVRRYGDILDDRDYWNRKHISYGTDWFKDQYAGNYFTEVFPCQLKFPDMRSGGETREDRAAFYTSDDADKAVFQTEFFIKLNPKKWGLADYNHKVWHRFTVAGDDTIIWAEPCAYSPVWFMGYDYDHQSARASSFSLECIPWQDQLGMQLSQMILTAKQNLANVIFYDKNMIDKTDIEKIQNSGEQKYRGFNFIGVDSMMLQRAGLDTNKAFHQVQLSYRDIGQFIQTISMTLNIMERVLQVTAQEVGATASHQQSKFELQQLGGASSNRVSFTASYVDDAIDAWKRQIVDGYQAYGDAALSVQVSADIPEIEKHLDELGFKIKDRGDKKVSVEGKKHTLRMETFARSNAGPERPNNAEVAAVLFQVVGVLSQQPELFKAVGTENVLALLEEGSKLAGARKDFRLKAGDKSEDGSVSPAIAELLQKVQASIMQTIDEKLTQPVAKEIAQDQQQISQLTETVERLKGIYQTAEAAASKQAVQTQEAQQSMGLKRQEFEAEQQRKQEEHRVAMSQLIEEARLKLGIQEAQAAAKIDQQKAAVAAKSEP